MSGEIFCLGDQGGFPLYLEIAQDSLDLPAFLVDLVATACSSRVESLTPLVGGGLTREGGFNYYFCQVEVRKCVDMISWCGFDVPHPPAAA